MGRSAQRARYYANVRRQSDRLFYALVGAALLPSAGIAFALVGATHEMRAAIGDVSAPAGGLCRQAIIYTLDPLVHVAYGGFAAIAAIAGALGAIAGVSTHFQTRRVLRDHRTVAIVPERLARLAAAAGIRRVRLISSPKALAFTHGYLAPEVAISETFLRALSDLQLEAVLLHEAEHVHRRDPLRVLVVTVLSRAFVLAPLFGRLAYSFRTAKEIEADKAVIRATGSHGELVSALLKSGLYDSQGAAAGFADALTARIASLEGGALPISPSELRTRAASLLAMAMIAAGLFVIATGALGAQALHMCGR